MGGSKSKIPQATLAYYEELTSGLILYIYSHDITTVEVDAIINPTTSKLENIGDGVSGTIGKKAGKKLKKDCDKVIEKNGEIEVGDNVDTKGYNVCKKLIHVATPEWSQYNENLPGHMEFYLHSALLKSFEKAVQLKVRKLAVPPIGLDSSRLQQDRVDIIADVAYKAIMDFVGRTSPNTLKEIHLVDMNEIVITTIATLFHEKNGKPLFPERPTPSENESSFGRFRNSFRSSKRKLLRKQQAPATELPLPENSQMSRATRPETVRARHNHRTPHTQNNWNDPLAGSQNSTNDYTEMPVPDTPRRQSIKLQNSTGVPHGRNISSQQVDRVYGYGRDDAHFYEIPQPPRPNDMYMRQAVPQGYRQPQTGHEQIGGYGRMQSMYGKRDARHVVPGQTDPYGKDVVPIQQNPDFLPEPVNVSYKQVLFQGPTIYVYRGDITTLNVDVIVNAANSRLQHSGGVAKAIAKKAGRQLEEEGNNLVKRMGHVPVGENVVTKGYNLPCKHVIHSVGPVWSQYPGDTKNKCVSDLYNAYFNSLKKAVELKARTVAIPAISAGAFAVPHEIVTNVMWDAVMDHSTKTPSIGNTLKQIHLVNITDSITEAIALTFKAKERMGAEPHEWDASEFFYIPGCNDSESSENEFSPAQKRSAMNNRNDGLYDTRRQYAEWGRNNPNAMQETPVYTKGLNDSNAAHAQANDNQNLLKVLPKPGNSHLARNPAVWLEQKAPARSDQNANIHYDYYSGASNNSHTDQTYNNVHLKEPSIYTEQKVNMRYPAANYGHDNSRYMNSASNAQYKNQWQQAEQRHNVPHQGTQRTNYGATNYANYNSQMNQVPQRPTGNYLTVRQKPNVAQPYSQHGFNGY